MGEHEIRCRLGAGFVLLAGILSLLVSFDRPDLQTEAVRATETVAVGIERAASGAATAHQSVNLAVPSVSERSDRVRGPSAMLGYSMSEKIEAWIERIEGLLGSYPWPTLLVGIGLGYVLARRRL
jgi:hypothetical protein